MLATLKAKIILGIIITVVVGLGVWRINHAFNEAAKVPELEKQVDDLKVEKEAFDKKLAEQLAAAKNRIADNAKIADKQTTNQKKLINENAKTTAIVIPVDKLRALLEADNAAN